MPPSVSNDDKKCPRCQDGDFFQFSFTYNPSKVIETHKNCRSCNLKYMLEPSFYIGAMYVNYGIIVAMCLLIFLVTTLVFSFSMLQASATVIIALFVFGPFNLRLSRIIWINMFVAYQKKSSKEL